MRILLALLPEVYSCRPELRTKKTPITPAKTKAASKEL
jgi:hypothetical protein